MTMISFYIVYGHVILTYHSTKHLQQGFSGVSFPILNILHLPHSCHQEFNLIHITFLAVVAVAAADWKCLQGK